MKNKIIGIMLTAWLAVSCASIPKETVVLSQAIGTDLQALRTAHSSLVQLYYDRIKTDINTFIDEVYAPYIIHYVLQREMENYKNGQPSLYGIIETAGKTSGKNEMDEALSAMSEFQEAANSQIAATRNELLQPVLTQEKELLNTITLSYQQTIDANTTLTTYLSSLRKIKDSQSEALATVGLQGLDTTVSKKLIELSTLTDKAVKEGENIDVKSSEALQQIEDIINKIKTFTK